MQFKAILHLRSLCVCLLLHTVWQGIKLGSGPMPKPTPTPTPKPKLKPKPKPKIHDPPEKAWA